MYLPVSQTMVVEPEPMVTLVDENDKEVGVSKKLEAHMGGGKLHRAFSVFIFDSNGRMLLQRRALVKYHSGGLWTNACCSHPSPTESTEAAAHRRLKEEMGFDCDLSEIFSFIYKTPVSGGLTEWEYDHVFVGKYNGKVKPDLNEIAEVKWVQVEDLMKDVRRNPSKYTEWLKLSLDKVVAHMAKEAGS